MLRKKRHLLFLFVFSLAITSCAALSPWFNRGSISVEMVLRRSQNIARKLDAEAAVSDDAAPRSARRLAMLQAPLRRLALNSPFGKRDGHEHTGVDLAAKEGTPVYAALDGIVVYADHQISGYGNTVIVRHAGDLATLYAHLSETQVELGAAVYSGQCIALSGHTGNASGPHLHFEVRDGLQAVDPQLRWRQTPEP